MKFYVASRTAREHEVVAIIKTLTDMGHTVTHDWTTFDFTIERPYPEELAREVAEKDIQGVSEADVFILLGDKGESGMYVELGYALAIGIPIYSVGQNNGQTVFQYMTNVKRVDTIEEVFKDLGKAT